MEKIQTIIFSTKVKAKDETFYRAMISSRSVVLRRSNEWNRIPTVQSKPLRGQNLSSKSEMRSIHLIRNDNIRMSGQVQNVLSH